MQCSSGRRSADPRQESLSRHRVWPLPGDPAEHWMSDWLISLEGTESGKTLALCLALLAAVLHAFFGALQKGKTDPWTARTVIDGSYSLIAVPFLFIVPFPEPHIWPLFAIAWVIHVGYKMSQAASYSVGSYLVVYPVVRGISP